MTCEQKHSIRCNTCVNTNFRFQVLCNGAAIGLTNAAKHVQQKMGYADGFGVTAREDWPDLMPTAIDAAADKIEQSMATNNADRVVLVPATGSGSGFDAVKEELDNRGIQYVVTEEPIPIGSKEFVQWAQKNVLGTTAFILKERPTENTVTPNWH